MKMNGLPKSHQVITSEHPHRAIASFSWRSSAAIVCVLILGLLLPFAPIASASSGKVEYSLTDSDKLPAEKGHPKLESALNDLVPGPNSERDLDAQDSEKIKKNRVQVILHVQDMAEASKAVKDVGGEIEASYRTLLQATVKPHALKALADNPVINYIRRPLPATPEVMSEGVATVGATRWHDVGYKGGGRKIAVLDLGFAGYEALLGSELPASVTAQSFVQGGDITGGGEPHGTACAELVYDMAPEAQLYLANFSTEVEFANAVEWLIQQKVDAISCSIIWVNAGPYDGTGMICDIVENAHANGILWVNAAGNGAHRHWEGIFQDSDNDRWHNYGEEEVNTFSVMAGQEISVFLSWNDSWTNASQDYDLYLFRWNGSRWRVVAYSANWQNGGAGQKPTEGISIIASQQGLYGTAIYRYNATGTEHLEHYSFTHDFEFQVSDSSLLIPADAEHVLSMGAFRWNTGQIEGFSSHGPTNDGRVKPDLLGPDFVTTVTYGSQGFGGTSSAAPHAAAAAILVKQAHPAWGPDEIKQYLKEHAADNPGLGSLKSASLYANNPPNNSAGAGNLELGSPTISAQLPLAAGWNLVSVPVTPLSTAIADVLSSIQGHYDLVYAYDAQDTGDPWKKYNVAAPPFLNDLTNIDEQMGFWIRTASAVTLTVTGTLPISTSIPLAPGWNLVGYPSQTIRPIAEALGSIAGKYDLVYAYDAQDTADPWKKYNVAAPPFLNDLTVMKPGGGYWIRATENCMWQINGE